MEPPRFGYKAAWLALRMDGPERVCDALGLMDVTPVPAKLGLRQATGGQGGRLGEWVFVGGPVDHWVLAVGDALFGFAERAPPDFESLISRLSEELQCEVQFFCTHRVIEAHGWGRAERGNLRRAFLFVGESGLTVADLGDETLEERDLGFAFFDPSGPEAADHAYWIREDLWVPQESDVLRLAGKWSIDPGKASGLADGWLGRLPANSTRRGRPWWRFWAAGG